MAGHCFSAGHTHDVAFERLFTNPLGNLGRRWLFDDFNDDAGLLGRPEQRHF